jgi:hypothetical protein
VRARRARSPAGGAGVLGRKVDRTGKTRQGEIMKRFVFCVAALAAFAVSASAQSLDDLNIQIHGYATQGFVYTTQNNWNTTISSNGSPSWTEAVINLTAQPESKLRIGVQGRYFLLGRLGNQIILDWANADYKVNDKLGVRFGKVKTPSGLFNETQDIDPSYMWALLPQGIYPLASRNSILAHYGGVVYGTLKLGPNLGKLEYRGFGGEREIGSDDGYFVNQNEEGVTLTNGLAGALDGGTLRWRTPVSGLMLGASDMRDTQWNAVLSYANSITVSGVGTFSGPFNGTYIIHPMNIPFYFASYEKGKFAAAGEYARLHYLVNLDIVVPALISYGYPYVQSNLRGDQRSWYGMASYKAASKLTAGLYHSQSFNRQASLGPSRYQKDWALSGRYDISNYLYLKAEQHFTDGTEIGYDITANSGGLKPNTRMTILKLGVTF